MTLAKIQTTLTELLEPIYAANLRTTYAANLRTTYAKVESGQTIGKIVLANF